jgi:hypothetical protein
MLHPTAPKQRMNLNQPIAITGIRSILQRRRSLNADLCLQIASRPPVPGAADQAFAARIVSDAELDGG